MRDHAYAISALALVAFLAAFLPSSCTGGRKADPAAEAPPLRVEHERDAGAFSVDHPEQFPLATAGKHEAASELNVTGIVSPDVSRNVPVVSLASGRVVDIRARLGDAVIKGELLMRVQSQDIWPAISDYRQAVANEHLARTQLHRSKLLYERGAIALK